MNQSIAVAPNGSIAVTQDTLTMPGVFGYADWDVRLLTPQATPFLTAAFQTKADCCGDPSMRQWSMTVKIPGPDPRSTRASRS